LPPLNERIRSGITEGGKGKLAKEKIALHYLLKASEAANTLHKIGAITDMELKTILKQRKEK